MTPHRGLIDTLFAEMKGRVKDDDAGVPQKDGAFVYWNAFDPGAEYRKWTGGQRERRHGQCH